MLLRSVTYQRQSQEQYSEVGSVRTWPAGRLGSLLLHVPRRVMFPQSGSSLGHARRWLLAGIRLCTLAIGINLTFGVHQWYIWIPPVIAGIAFLLADIPFAYRDKHSLQDPDRTT